jgi:hypothetical protein
MKRRHLALVLVLALLAGCATTQIAEFQNPEGQVRRCQPNVEALVMGSLFSTEAVANEMARYRTCKDDAERAGFVRIPAGQETEETKQMIRDADAARAASIRKP